MELMLALLSIIQGKVEFAADDLAHDTANMAVSGTKTAARQGRKLFQRQREKRAAEKRRENTATTEQAPAPEPFQGTAPEGQTPQRHSGTAPEGRLPRQRTDPPRNGQRPRQGTGSTQDRRLPRQRTHTAPERQPLPRYYSKSNNTITVHVRHLREKLGDSMDKPRFIKTIWGVGYKIEN